MIEKDVRILYVCDYPAWDRIAKGEMPAHHLFGLAYWVKQWKYENGAVVSASLSEDFLGGAANSVSVDFLLMESTWDISKIVSVYKKSKDYDVIYDSLNHLKVLCVLRRLGLFRTKIISIMHHPYHYASQLKYSYSDAYIFFHESQKQYAESITGQRNNYYVNRWGPDIAWYKNDYSDCSSYAKQYDFIDNGRTSRDRDLVLRTSVFFNDSTFMLSGDSDLRQNNVFTYKVEVANSEKETIDRMLKSKYMLIPLKDQPAIVSSPTGVTSFMDAIAYGMPVICSDNFLYSDCIENRKLGIVYKTGDDASFIKTIKYAIEHEGEMLEYGNNMKKFADDSLNNLVAYSKKLQYIFSIVLNNE